MSDQRAARRGGPIRTCVGCRRREPNSQLLRLALDTVGVTHVVRPDVAGRLPGRGVWIHPTAYCMGLAERRRAIGRALRTTAVFDTAPVWEQIRSADANPVPPARAARDNTKTESGFDADEQPMSTQR